VRIRPIQSGVAVPGHDTPRILQRCLDAVDENEVRTRPEEATANAVARSKRPDEGWRLIGGLYVAGHGDIGQVLVGPGGVFVIESKWTTNPCRIELGEIVGFLGRVPIVQASDAAVKVERLLRRASRRIDVIVKPVVVIWGPGGLCLPQGWTDVDGVLVCEGRRHRDWVRQLTGQPVARAEIEGITSILDAGKLRRTA
jgi:hypothetical protein